LYAYSVDEVLFLDVAAKYGPRVANLMTAQESKFAPSSDESVFQDIIRYANIVGRYPIYVYEPDMSERLLKNFVYNFFEQHEVHQAKTLKHDTSVKNKKIIYFNKFTANWDQPVPLLISGQGMMHGGDKTILLQQAEKVVYFATEVYNVFAKTNK
jgi:hypothetical protein